MTYWVSTIEQNPLFIILSIIKSKMYIVVALAQSPRAFITGDAVEREVPGYLGILFSCGGHAWFGPC